MLNDPLPIDLDKEYLINTYLRLVYSISSKEYQKRVWINAIGPEVGDFDETCMNLADCNWIVKYPKEFGLNKKQSEIIIKFTKAFFEFSDENDWPPFFIDTPEWTQITKMAKEVLRAFNYTPS